MPIGISVIYFNEPIDIKRKMRSNNTIDPMLLTFRPSIFSFYLNFGSFSFMYISFDSFLFRPIFYPSSIQSTAKRTVSITSMTIYYQTPDSRRYNVMRWPAAAAEAEAALSDN